MGAGQGSGRRVDHLDGIRALAIGSVVAVHWVDDYTPIGGGGHLGVPVFFALSGWIITTILWRTDPGGSLGTDVAAFLRRRAHRLLPALSGLVVVMILASLVVPIGPLDTLDVIRQAALAMVQLTWVESGRGTYETAFGHTWSLGIEWLFYLVWPWLLLGLRSRGASARALAGLSGALAVVLYAASFSLGELWFTFGPVTGTAVMLAGAALALAMADGSVDARRVPPAFVLDAAAALVLVLFTVYVLVGFRTFDPGVRWVGIPLATLTGLYLIWYGFARAGGRVRSLLTLPAVTFLGRVSYSLYLFHLVGAIVLDKDTTPLPMPVLGLIAIGMTILLTALSYRFLEQPFTRSRGTILAGRTDAVGAGRVR